MPFCTQCGNQVSPVDSFCAVCGLRQTPGPSSASRAGSGDLLGNVSRRTASLLCYIPFVGWIAGIVVLASPKFREDLIVRFHAFQGLYLFVTWLIIEVAVEPFLRIARPPGSGAMHLIVGLLNITVFGAWIWMIIKTSQEEMFRLPILGELADRSVAEQR